MHTYIRIYIHEHVKVSHLQNFGSIGDCGIVLLLFNLSTCLLFLVIVFLVFNKDVTYMHVCICACMRARMFMHSGYEDTKRCICNQCMYICVYKNTDRLAMITCTHATFMLVLMYSTHEFMRLRAGVTCEESK